MRSVERALAVIVALIGAVAWVICLRANLVLSHYDAKAHLVVARRVFDSITPGWQQIGAVWLPLPHLINLFPTQIDVLYRTGAFASLVSIACFAVTAWASARLILHITGSRTGAITGAAILALNPNLLYVQATPMTEPLLLAVTFVLVLWLYEWIDNGAAHVPLKLGLVLFAAAWTRYEAWMVIAAAGSTTGVALWRRGVPFSQLVTRLARLAIWPALAIALFVINSRITVGAWFVTGGFYVPDPMYAGRALKTALAIWWGTHRLSGYVVEACALGTAAFLCVRALTRPEHALSTIPVALVATAALPFYAFYEGHPYRIRYMLPIVAGCALLDGIGVGLVVRAAGYRPRSRWRRPAAVCVAIALIASTLVESPPWRAGAPMVEEAQWDVPASLQRQQVTACLAPAYRGEKVMASMGSLAHYMQELSLRGFAIADFVHEGNGVIWELALETGPAPHAGWMLVEEQAEGGDILAQRIRRDPSFARGMVKVCEGGGVTLYQRQPPIGPVAQVARPYRPNLTPTVN